jgi:hypothetical protein
MQKNTAGKWIVFAFQDEGGTNPGEPVTGDDTNITANVRIDGAAANAVDDTNPTELEDGYYIFDLTAAETNGDLLLLCPESATANVNVIGVPGAVWTTPANFNTMGIESDGDLTQVNTLAGHTAQTGDSFARLGAPAGASVSADIAQIDTEVGDILVDTSTTLDTHLTDIKGTGFAKDTHSLTDITADVTGLNGDAMRGTDSAALASVCTEARLAELDAGNIPADVDNILTDTGTTLDTHLTDIKGTGFAKDTHSLTDITADVTGLNGDAMRGTDSAALASVCTEARLAELDAANIPADVDNILTDTGTTGVLISSGTGSGQLNITSGVVDSNIEQINNNAAAAVRLALSAGQIIPGTVSTAVLTPTTSAFAADDITESTADHYNGRVIIWTSGALTGQATSISGYSLVSAEGNFTVVAMTEAPANNDTFIII